MSSDVDSIVAEEVALGVYEDVESTATEHSEHMDNPEKSEYPDNNEEPTTPVQQVAQNITESQPPDSNSVTPADVSGRDSKVTLLTNQQPPLRHKSCVPKLSKERTHNANSLDVALQIKSLHRIRSGSSPPLSSPVNGAESRCRSTPVPTIRVQTEADTNRLPTDAEGGRPVDSGKEFESVVKDIEYITKKCVGTDTRRGRTAPAYSSRKSAGPGDSQSYARSLLRSQSSAENVLVYQNRPSPMTPLRVWKGYTGNLYFAPLSISRVNSVSGAIETVSRSQPGSAAPISNRQTDRHRTATTDISSMAFHCELPQKPAVVLDKEIVMNKSNKDIQEDLEWIRNTENVGSLRIEKGSGDSRTKERRQDRKSAVHKGSVAHQLAKHRGEKVKGHHRNFHNSKSLNSSAFEISGDKYNTYNGCTNPLLMATTQYSQSSHRPRSMASGHHREVEELGAQLRTQEMTSCYKNINNRSANKLPALKHLQNIKADLAVR